MFQGLSDTALLRIGLLVAAVVLFAVIAFTSRRKSEQGKRLSSTRADTGSGRLERTLRRDEAIPCRICLQAADVEVHLFGQPESIPSNLNELAGSDERFDVPFERRLVVLGHFEHLQQLAHAGGMMHPLAHEREHLIA